ncbi:MAG: hypothetical protein ACI9C4_000848 [Paraglaciecola sp.]|jgi:hypothetical protein
MTVHNANDGISLARIAEDPREVTTGVQRFPGGRCAAKISFSPAIKDQLYR